MTGHGFFGMLALPHVVRIAQREAAVNDVLENRNPNEMQYTGAAVDGTTGAPCHQLLLAMHHAVFGYNPAAANGGVPLGVPGVQGSIIL